MTSRSLALAGLGWPFDGGLCRIRRLSVVVFDVRAFGGQAGAQRPD
jgi:hypothetical protein